MSLARIIDIRTGCEIAGNASRSIDSNERSSDMFSEFDLTVQALKARFGINSLPNGVVYKQDLKRRRSFDTYGHGCVHNSIHQYRPRKGEVWNRPIPLPADLRALDAFLKSRAGKRLALGVKSDPFMWMDRKFGVTKSVLELANKYNVVLHIRTMSDLCGHDDYAELLAQGGHTIEMHLGYGPLCEALERQASPGAPSVLRRNKAIKRLRERGVLVTTKTVLPSKAGR